VYDDANLLAIRARGRLAVMRVPAEGNYAWFAISAIYASMAVCETT
jgi:hypothetical protein